MGTEWRYCLANAHAWRLPSQLASRTHGAGHHRAAQLASPHELRALSNMLCDDSVYDARARAAGIWYARDARQEYVRAPCA